MTVSWLQQYVVCVTSAPSVQFSGVFVVVYQMTTLLLGLVHDHLATVFAGKSLPSKRMPCGFCKGVRKSSLWGLRALVPADLVCVICLSCSLRVVIL